MGPRATKVGGKTMWVAPYSSKIPDLQHGFVEGNILCRKSCIWMLLVSISVNICKFCIVFLQFRDLGSQLHQIWVTIMSSVKTRTFSRQPLSSMAFVLGTPVIFVSFTAQRVSNVSNKHFKTICAHKMLSIYCIYMYIIHILSALMCLRILQLLGNQWSVSLCDASCKPEEGDSDDDFLNEVDTKWERAITMPPAIGNLEAMTRCPDIDSEDVVCSPNASSWLAISVPNTTERYLPVAQAVSLEKWTPARFFWMTAD